MSKLNTPDAVLDFWFSESVKPLWFKKSAKFDWEINQRFINTYQLAKIGALNEWRDVPQNILALVIVLEQFPRNMFRDTPQAFATDAQAVELAKHAIAQNFQQELSQEQQTFLYMPLMHSENKTDQAKCVELFTNLGKEDNLKFAIRHQEIINRFSRFPHRNEILSRKSTLAEQEFLTQLASSF